jgi:hypothetical protein
VSSKTVYVEFEIATLETLIDNETSPENFSVVIAPSAIDVDCNCVIAMFYTGSSLI